MKQYAITNAQQASTEAKQNNSILQHVAVNAITDNVTLPTTDKVVSSPRQSLDATKHIFMKAGFEHDFSQVPVSLIPGAIQTKLSVSQPSDRYEQEADRIADLVMRMPDSHTEKNLGISNQVQTQPSEHTLQRLESKEDFFGDFKEQHDVGSDEPIAVEVFPGNKQATKEHPEEEESTVQRKENNDPVDVSTSPLEAATLHEQSGSPLTNALQADMGRRFDADFSSVRVHTGSQADAMCKSIAARAFTYKNDIYFAANEYQPSSTTGQHLLAHELTHTIQQGAATFNNRRFRSVLGSIFENSLSPLQLQRKVDFSIMLDQKDLGKLIGIVPITKQPHGNQFREIEQIAYDRFNANQPIYTKMKNVVTWYYINPVYTNMIFQTRYWPLLLTIPNNGSWLANDVYELSFIYKPTDTRKYTGEFSISSGTSGKASDNLSGGGKLSYGFVEIASQYSRQTERGTSFTVGAKKNELYEHDYNVSVKYKLTAFSESNFKVERRFFGGPKLLMINPKPTVESGELPIGTITLKDDDSNPDNLTESSSE